MLLRLIIVMGSDHGFASRVGILSHQIKEFRGSALQLRRMIPPPVREESESKTEKCHSEEEDEEEELDEEALDHKTVHGPHFSPHTDGYWTVSKVLCRCNMIEFRRNKWHSQSSRLNYSPSSPSPVFISSVDAKVHRRSRPSTSPPSMLWLRRRYRSSLKRNVTHFFS